MVLGGQVTCGHCGGHCEYGESAVCFWECAEGDTRVVDGVVSIDTCVWAFNMRILPSGVVAKWEDYFYWRRQLAFWINYGPNLHLSGRSQSVIPLALQLYPPSFSASACSSQTNRRATSHNRIPLVPSRCGEAAWPPSHAPVRHWRDGAGEQQLEEERALTGGTSTLSMLKEAFTVKSYRRRSILCITLMMWSNLTGTNAMTYYSPTIFASVGLSGSSVGLFVTGIYGIVKMISCAIFIFFVTNSLGRRKSLLWTALAQVGVLRMVYDIHWLDQGVALFYVGFYIRFDPPVKGQPISARGYVALVAIYIFAAVYQFGWGPVVWTYCSEIPPARLRALMMGMAVASQWLFNFVGTSETSVIISNLGEDANALTVAKATPSMFATLGRNGFGTYFVYGSFSFLMVIYAWFLVPETKGLSLEYMDQLFEQGSARAKFSPPAMAGWDSEGSQLDGDKKEARTHLERV